MNSEPDRPKPARNAWTSPALAAWNQPVVLLAASRIADATQPFRSQPSPNLEGLTRSIDDIGILDPLLVRQVENGGYALIDGHARLACARKLGYKTVPAVVLAVSEFEALKLGLDRNREVEFVGTEIQDFLELLCERLNCKPNDIALRVSRFLQKIVHVSRADSRASLAEMNNIRPSGLQALAAFASAPAHFREAHLRGTLSERELVAVTVMPPTERLPNLREILLQRIEEDFVNASEPVDDGLAALRDLLEAFDFADAPDEKLESVLLSAIELAQHVYEWHIENDRDAPALNSQS